MTVNVLRLVQWIVINVTFAKSYLIAPPSPTATQTTSFDETSHISNALIDVINKSFLEDVPIINIITSTSDNERIKRLMDEMSNEIARNISSAASVRVNDLESFFILNEKRFYNVILLTNFESFQKLQQIIDGEQAFYFQGYFLIALVQKYETQYEDMEKIFNHMWQRFIINVNILISISEVEVEMFTIYPYTSAYCGKAFPIPTNRFINSSFIQTANYFDADKLKNLFGCPLKVVTFNIAPLMFVTETTDGRYSFRGIDGELLKGNILWIIGDCQSVISFIARNEKTLLNELSCSLNESYFENGNDITQVQPPV